MATLPLDQAVARFQGNDDRLDRFINGDATTDMVTSGGQLVPSVRKIIANVEAELDLLPEGVPEAPEDGNLYVRQNKTWQVIPEPEEDETPTQTKYPSGVLTGQTIDIDSDFPYPIVFIGGVPQKPTSYTLANGIITSIAGDWPVGADYAVWVGGNKTFVATDPVPPVAANVQGLQEAVEDILNDAVIPGTGITKNYNDTTGKLTLAATAVATNEALNPLMFGAVGNNDSANAAADTAGINAALDALSNYPERPGTLDLLGRKYWVNNRLQPPGAGNFHHKRITNATIKVTADFPAMTPLLDLSGKNAYASKLDYLYLEGHRGNGGIPWMKEGILLNATQEFRIEHCDIEGFDGVIGNTGAGIRSLSTEYGRQTYIESCQIAANFGSLQTRTVGIDLWGGDTQLINNTVRECETLVVFRKGAHRVMGGHYYYFDHPFGDGISVWEANHVYFGAGAYIDSCGVTFEGYGFDTPMGRRLVSSCAFNGVNWLTHPFRDMPSNFGFLNIKPREANMVMHGLVISGCNYQRNRTAASDTWPVRVSGANGGSINPDAIYQSHMFPNAFDGVKQMTTRPRVESPIPRTDSFFTATIPADTIPWGRAQRAMSVFFQTATGNISWWSGGVDKANNNVTVYTSAPVAGRAVAVFDTNNDAR